MLNYIHEYRNPAEAEFNEDFIYGRDDTPIAEFVTMVMQDFESVGNIEILSVELVDDQDEIDYNRHTININFKKKHLDRIEIPKNKFIANSRYAEMIFRIRVSTNLNEQVIEKRLLIPVEEDGFFLLNNKTWKAIWQLCDANTYTQRGRVTFKSRMPIIIYQTKNRLVKDVTGKEWNFISYSYAMDTKSRRKGSKKKTKFINPMMIYASKMGMRGAIDFFNMTDIVTLTQTVDEDDMSVFSYFQINEVYARVSTELLEKFPIVRSIICMLTYCANKDFPVTWQSLENTEYWICRIGYIGSVKNRNILSFRDKGYTTLHMFERLLDDISIKNLRLPDVYKQDIYYIMYWIIMNFDVLRTRNNMDMMNKRVRRNEYIVMSSLGKKVSENINKLIEKKSKSKMNTMDTLLELFNFPSDIIISGMKNISDVVKSDEIVNDMNFLMDLAYSSKGPNSLGEASSKMISAKYRYPHPSQLGILDVNVSSNSDPGMSGSFVPFVKTYGLFFNPEPDPCKGEFETTRDLNAYIRGNRQLTKAIPELKTAPLTKATPKQVESFDSFLKYTSKQRSRFNTALKPLEILIVEKDTSLPIVTPTTVAK